MQLQEEKRQCGALLYSSPARNPWGKAAQQLSTMNSPSSWAALRSIQRQPSLKTGTFGTDWGFA